MKHSGFKSRTRPMGDSTLSNGFKARTSGLKSRQLAVTAAEKQFWNQLAEVVGCVACRIDGRINTHVSIHHIDGRTKPGCHRNVLPLCAPHHQQDDTDPLGRLSIHGHRKPFEAKYGTEAELLAGALNILGVGQ